MVLNLHMRKQIQYITYTDLYSQLMLVLGFFFFFFFEDVCIYYVCSVHACISARRGYQISYQMDVTHHVVAEN